MGEVDRGRKEKGMGREQGRARELRRGEQREGDGERELGRERQEGKRDTVPVHGDVITPSLMGPGV